MTYDQAQSPRLGQKLAPENPGIQIRSVSTLPEVAYRGMVVYAADADSLAVYDGSAWQFPNSSATQVFIATTEPAADNIGDLWYDPSTSVMHVWDGTDWVAVVDPAVAALEIQVSANLSAITELQSDIAGVITTYYDTVEPTSPNEGDLWFNESTNRLYRYDGTDWEEIKDQDAINAIAAADLAQDTADRKIDTYHANTAPTVDAIGDPLGPEDAGDLWFDLDDGDRLYRWSGSAWVDVQDAQIAQHASQISGLTSDLAAVESQVDQKISIYYASTFPWVNGSTAHDADFGDLFSDTDDGSAWRWEPSRTWVAVPDAAAALAAANAAQATADGKINHYVSSTRPWADGLTTHDLDVGDIWTDTSTGNVDYYWRISPSRAWVQLPKGYGAVSSGAVDNSTITGSTIQTALSGNRMVMHQDSGAGEIAGWTGLAGEVTPTTINPGLTLGTYPSLIITSGTTTTYTEAATLALFSMTTAANAGQVLISNAVLVLGAEGLTQQGAANNFFGGGVTIQGTTTTNGALTVNGGATGTFNGTHTGTWSGTFTSSVLPVQACAGSVNVTVSSSNIGNQVVGFPFGMSSTPFVVCSAVGTSLYNCAATSVDASGFLMNVRHVNDVSQSTTVTVNWIAMIN